MKTIDPPSADHHLLSGMPPETPATAIAVAEQVPVRADQAADAAIIPFPAPATSDPTLAPLPPLVPCVDHVPEFTRGVLDGVVQDIIGLKNVPLLPDEARAAATAVFDALTLAETYQFALGDLTVLGKVAALVTDHLDGVAVQRMIRIVAAIEAKPPDDPHVVATTTALCRAIHAKQDPCKTMVWPEPLAAVVEHYRTVAKAKKASGEADKTDGAPLSNRTARRAVKKALGKIRRAKTKRGSP